MKQKFNPDFILNINNKIVNVTAISYNEKTTTKLCYVIGFIVFAIVSVRFIKK